MAIGAAAKGEIEPVPESYEVCEGVVLAIVEHASDVGHLDCRRGLSADGSQDSKPDESGYQTSFHASRVWDKRRRRSSSLIPERDPSRLAGQDPCGISRP